ncbi:MAG: hypothetical protein M1834_001797 [Cirrosporium novae-zelandiae]|nr:MAG: hypothetical protein M1834_001797 [Cirrosporium novae-zelandiae]
MGLRPTIPKLCLLRLPRSSTSSSLQRSYATTVESPPQRPVEASVQPGMVFAPPPTRDEAGFAMRTYKPITPGIRWLKRPINDHLWKGRPFYPLTFPKKGQARGGRNSTGRVTVRHRGGGHKRRIRTVDFMRLESGPHVVERIEHDPNRSAHIALVTSKDTGKKSYIIAADGLRAGDVVQSYRSGIPKQLLESMGGRVDPGVLAARTAWRGNCLPLHMIPIGTLIHNVGILAKGAGQMCRSAGTFATVVAKDDETREGQIGKKVTIRLQSGEVRTVSSYACATVGVASNPHHQHRSLGKAGRKRWLGIRPTVRGVAMNAVDHPHGGGRGKSKGNVHPVSPWGQPAKSGYKTRPKNKPNKAVVQERHRNQGKRRRGAKS